MIKIDKIQSLAHKAVLAYAAAFTIPALLAFFLVDNTASGPRILESVMPVWMWLMGLWFLAVSYFCGCLIVSGRFRETMLTWMAGFRERDEREEIVTAKAARSVYLVTLGCFVIAGLIGMVRLNGFSYSRWQGDSVPPVVKVGSQELRRGRVTGSGVVIWPSIGIPRGGAVYPHASVREIGNTRYYYDSGFIFGPEVSRTFFSIAALLVLLFHLFARRVRV